MKSGLGDRNNGVSPLPALPDDPVSMKSGLGDRNNRGLGASGRSSELGLNEVRSWRPEQCPMNESRGSSTARLNEVRSWRPEQLPNNVTRVSQYRSVSMKSGLGDRNNFASEFSCFASGLTGLNEVRSWRPEQFNFAPAGE